jgi:hypothetical protein
MNTTHFRIRLDDGKLVSHIFFSSKGNDPDLEARCRQSVRKDHPDRQIVEITVTETLGGAPFERPRAARSTSATQPSTKVARCCSALVLAHRLLPRSIRADALTEWVDEIEAAADVGAPIMGRTLSIILRAVPSLAFRERRPARVRDKGM